MKLKLRGARKRRERGRESFCLNPPNNMKEEKMGKTYYNSFDCQGKTKDKFHARLLANPPFILKRNFDKISSALKRVGWLLGYSSVIF